MQLMQIVGERNVRNASSSAGTLDGLPGMMMRERFAAGK